MPIKCMYLHKSEASENLCEAQEEDTRFRDYTIYLMNNWFAGYNVSEQSHESVNREKACVPAVFVSIARDI